jgi:hypothetical protein
MDEAVVVITSDGWSIREKGQAQVTEQDELGEIVTRGHWWEGDPWQVGLSLWGYGRLELL